MTVAVKNRDLWKDHDLTFMEPQLRNTPAQLNITLTCLHSNGELSGNFLIIMQIQELLLKMQPEWIGSQVTYQD